MFVTLVVCALQTCLGATVCAALYYGWTRTTSRDPLLRIIIGLGLALRLIAGQVLFWTSYLHLPIGRSLQMGNGLWFFAYDAITYFAKAAEAADAGLAAIATMDRTIASVMYVQSLALSIYLLGIATSVALLLNATTYLATCAVLTYIVDSAPDEDQFARALRLVVIGSLTFSPSLVLWSFQPLKDTVFVFLIIVVFGAVWWLERASHSQEHRAFRSVLGAAVLWIAMYAIASVRWYYAFVLLILSAAVVLFVVIRSKRRFTAALLGSAFVIALSRALVFGAGPYVPDQIRVMLGAYEEARPLQEAGGATVVLREIDIARMASEQGGGRSMIRLRTKLDPSVDADDDGYEVPTSIPGRLIAGSAAVLIPHFVSDSAGILRIDGRREFWPIVDAGTFLFDLVLGVTVLAIVMNWRAAKRDPMTWLVTLSTAAFAIAVVYVGANFGTLWRHRDMIFAGLLTTIAVAGTAKARRDRHANNEAGQSFDLIVPTMLRDSSER